MEKPRDYPVQANLALHLIESLMDDFDLASSQRLPEGEGEGHAMAYIHRRVMDETNPIPIVPVFLNTYYPPNQPRPRRCYAFGQAVRKAVESFPGNLRVGIAASGGLSHFLVDEEFDKAILKACADKNAEYLKNLPRKSCRPAPPRSSTGSRSQVRSSTSTSTGSNTCRAIARRQAPAPG